ncbi:MAG TPA: PilN domain-containing protein [Acidobacteriota bacterium]|nr:PilN domain-containing protein [Acidobacteriota bacterium]HND18771.1 PilN domain-containing protein [Acidobacteriota bacterium]HNH84209.1 PilN domain-containing protein [Acidobacteriota bacterium]
MLGVIRFGYQSAGVTLGIVKTDGKSGPTLVHLEQLASQADAVATLQSIASDIQVLTIYPSPVEVRPGEAFMTDLASSVALSNLVTARCDFDATLMLAYLDPMIVEHLPVGSVLCEAACLAEAFTTVYGREAEQAVRAGHLHLSRTQIDWFVYERGELVGHSLEVLDTNDIQGFENAMNLMIDDVQTRLQSAFELVVVSGECTGDHRSRMDWLRTQLQAELIQVFDLAGLQPPSAAMPATSLAVSEMVPLLGAVYAYLNDHGADFRGMVRSRPVAHQPPGLIDQLKGLVAGAVINVTPSGTRRVEYLGVVLGLVAIAVLVGGQYTWLVRREAQLQLEQSVQTRRAEANQALKQEAEQYRQYLDALNHRIEVVNKMREAQGMNYQISNDVSWQVPSGLVLTTLKVQGRNVTISGYVTPTTVTQAQAEAGQPLVLDVVDPVADFVRNLEGAGRYTNVQSNYDLQPQEEKSDFTITCQYQGNVFTDPIEPQPVPELVVKATENTTAAPKTATPAKSGK